MLFCFQFSVLLRCPLRADSFKICSRWIKTPRAPPLNSNTVIRTTERVSTFQYLAFVQGQLSSHTSIQDQIKAVHGNNSGFNFPLPENLITLLDTRTESVKPLITYFSECVVSMCKQCCVGNRGRLPQH